MKKLIISAICILAALNSQANNETKPDSVIVNFGEKTRIVIYGEKKEDIKKLLKYDVNKVLRDLSIKLDTTKTNRITINGVDAKRNEANEEIANIKLGDSNYNVSVDDGKLMLEKRTKDKDGKETTTRTQIGRSDSIKTQGGRGGNNGVNITLGGGKKNKEWYADKKENFVLSLGLNAYGKDNTSITAFKPEEYDLRPLGSRYVALGFYRKGTIAKGQNAALRIKSGFEFSWYNLMFEGNNVVQNTTPVTFPNATEALSKTKLTACYVNVPLMIMPTFRQGAISHIGFGGYAGYRLDSHTKTKTQGSGNKDHVNGRFGLNQFRYGLAAEIGFRKSFDIFGQYDLSPLFEANKGPNVQMISFGIRLR